MENKFSRSKVSYHDLLLDWDTVQLIASFTNSEPYFLRKKCKKLFSYILNSSKNEGIVNVCKRIKESHRRFLLTGKTSWFSLKHVSGKLISDICTRILLSIHRNMTNPILDYSIETIQHKKNKSSISRFFLKYSEELNDLSNLIYFQAHNKLFHEGTQVSEEEFEKQPLLRKMIYDTTVDSNNRTGGTEYPIRVTLAKSANGDTIGSQSRDAVCLVQENNKHLLSSIKTLWWFTGRKLDLNYYKTAMSAGLLTSSEGDCLSRLCAIQDRSCKTRVIAIMDTFTQIALRPIHFLLEKVMRKNPNDFFHNHNKGVQYLMSLKKEMFSFDITSATDTIPVELGLWVLKNSLLYWECKDMSSWHVSRIVSATKKLLTERKFRVGNSDKFVTYSCGQPMGAYSSFPMLGLSQHLLVYLSARIVYGKTTFIDYAVVGDDLVICDKRTAEKYLELTRELKIPINLSKSIQGFNTFEFCSRIVVNGNLRSTPSFKSFYEAVKSKQPYPLLKVFQEYGVKLPRYEKLITFFDKDIVDSMLQTQDIKLEGSPNNLKRIPDDIYRHAERVFTIEDSLKKKIPEINTSDPFISRLNYGKKIQSFISSKIKKDSKSGKHIWFSVKEIVANTFYLGYYDTYVNRDSLLRERYSPYRSSKRITKSMKIVTLCNLFQNLWKGSN